MISLKHFAYAYQKRAVLRDIDLEIPNGRIVVVVGQNGSGKSTLAQILSGLRLDFQGEVWLDELKLERRTPITQIRQKVSLVLQNPDNQIIFQTVHDDLAFVLHNLGVDVPEHDGKIARALEAVGMSDYLKANTYELSGGQKQRIIIASAILTCPRYLILDEATSMLDPSGKRSIYNILQDLKKQGVTSLLMTNWLDEIALADEILVLDEAKIFHYSRIELFQDLTLLEKHHLEIPLTLKLLNSPEGKKFLC